MERRGGVGVHVELWLAVALVECLEGLCLQGLRSSVVRARWVLPRWFDLLLLLLRDTLHSSGGVSCSSGGAMAGTCVGLHRMSGTMHILERRLRFGWSQKDWGT